MVIALCNCTSHVHISPWSVSPRSLVLYVTCYLYEDYMIVNKIAKMRPDGLHLKKMFWNVFWRHKSYFAMCFSEHNLVLYYAFSKAHKIHTWSIIIINLNLLAFVADGNLPVNTVCELVHKSLSETPNELLRSCVVVCDWSLDKAIVYSQFLSRVD